jgi:hypothetical protein
VRTEIGERLQDTAVKESEHALIGAAHFIAPAASRDLIGPAWKGEDDFAEVADSEVSWSGGQRATRPLIRT